MRANTIHAHCTTQALIRCPNNGAYCRAYVPGFVKTCMIENGAAPEYIMLLAG